MGKVDFRGPDLPQQNATTVPSDTESPGKVPALKFDLPQIGPPPSPNRSDTFPGSRHRPSEIIVIFSSITGIFAKINTYYTPLSYFTGDCVPCAPVFGTQGTKIPESAPCVPVFGTQGTGATHGGHRSRRGKGGGAGAGGRRSRPWLREREGPTSEATWEG